MVELRYVHPDYLHDYWLLIKDDLEECRIQDTDDAWPEDIYWMLKSGYASLHVAFIREAYHGFCILQKIQDPYSKKPKLCIWYANCNAGHSYVTHFRNEIEKIARGMGANKIFFKSTRKAFERLFNDAGYLPRETTYEKQL